MSTTIKILTTSKTDFPQWGEYYDRLTQKSVYHSPDYIRFLENHYQDNAELFVFGDEERFVYYPYFRKRLDRLPFAGELPFDASKYCDISSSWYYGGPLYRYERTDEEFHAGFLRSFREHAAGTGIVTEFIRFDPNLLNRRYYAGETTFFDRETVYVDMAKTEDDIWNGFSADNRRRVRNLKSRHQYDVLAVSDSDEERWRLFYGLYSSEIRRKNAPLHLRLPFSFFEGLRRALTDNCLLVAVEKDGIFSGGALILFDEHAAFLYLSATRPALWREGITNFLYYHCILLARERGASVFDLMGGREGVYRFKSQFSLLRREFFTAKVVHQRSIFEYLCRTDKTYDTLYFPPYRSNEQAESGTSATAQTVDDYALRKVL